SLMRYKLFLTWIFFSNWFFLPTIAQTIPAGSPVFEEALRRKQLLGEFDSSISFNVRPLRINFLTDQSAFDDYTFFQTGAGKEVVQRKTPKKAFSLLPIQNTISFNSGRPYGWGNGLMIPNVGGQNYTTAGLHFKFHFLNVQLQPEMLWAQNRPYPGYPNTF